MSLSDLFNEDDDGVVICDLEDYFEYSATGTSTESLLSETLLTPVSRRSSITNSGGSIDNSSSGRIRRISFISGASSNSYHSACQSVTESTGGGTAVDDFLFDDPSESNHDFDDDLDRNFQQLAFTKPSTPKTLTPKSLKKEWESDKIKLFGPQFLRANGSKKTHQYLPGMLSSPLISTSLLSKPGSASSQFNKQRRRHSTDMCFMPRETTSATTKRINLGKLIDHVVNDLDEGNTTYTNTEEEQNGTGPPPSSPVSGSSRPKVVRRASRRLQYSRSRSLDIVYLPERPSSALFSSSSVVHHQKHDINQNTVVLGSNNNNKSNSSSNNNQASASTPADSAPKRPSRCCSPPKT